MTGTIILHDSNPYIKNLEIQCFLQSWDGKWTVRWRDFYSEKQDVVFRRFSDAQIFKGKVTATARIVDLEQLACWGETVESMSAWWAEVYK